MIFVMFVFFKQKTAYEMRISDWSSDVCSSDLVLHELGVNLSQVAPCFLVPRHETFAVHPDAAALNVRELVGRGHVEPLEDAAEPRLFIELGTELPVEPERVPRVQIGRASCRERVCQYV